MQLSIVEQFKLYRQYQSIVTTAERFFKTSAVFNNFKEAAYNAFNEGNLDDFQFAIDALTTLEANQSSPLYTQQVDLLTESPLFDNFVNLLSTISTPHQDTETIEAPASFGQAVQDNLQMGEEQSLVHSSIYTPEEASELFPQTNKILINTNTTMDQSEKLLSGDGIITNPQAFTNNQIEQARFESFSKQLSESSSASETENIIEEFTPTNTISSYASTEDTSSLIAMQQEEYAGQVDPYIITDQTQDISVKIQEEILKIRGGRTTEEMGAQANPALGLEPTMC